MTTRQTLDAIAAKRILILDGAMGTMVQTWHLTEDDFRGSRFADHRVNLSGCNDLLCLTRPDVISAIHEAYLEAGADIIESCSFNATSVSLADYGIGDLAYEINAAAAALARNAADKFSTAERPRFVAGSMGPTSKSGSMSPDMDDPGKRAVTWDELEAAFYDSARGLIDGGADLLLLETCFDTLNAKAAIAAINRLREERAVDRRPIDIPLMISATVSDAAGRVLSGQTVEAFCVSVLHADPWSIGLNCSFGAEKLKVHIRDLAAIAPCRISVHPNAGLPNQMGAYDETPETMAHRMEEYFTEGLVNIVGGCCGSTPPHIAAIAEKAKNYRPRVIPKAKPETVLAGLEVLKVSATAKGAAGLEVLSVNGASGAAKKVPGTTGTDASGKVPGTCPAKPGLVNIGERTNVAGCRKFLTLIQEEKYDEALSIARDMIENGASIINIGMDDALLDAQTAMKAFLNLALSDPDIARVPVMIDSSRWEVIETGLKCVQGKALVNSISLKEGEAEFLRRARRARNFGAAVVVMLFDEQGQAVSYERKIEIAGRAYALLTGDGFPPEDIVFDPNVLSIVTGIPEHDVYALNFIRACSWIRDNCPGVQISGGISNLSFSFRGNDTVREAMHSVFLKHAVAAGLTMAIVNPAGLISYDEIDPELRDAVEAVILGQGSSEGPMDFSPSAADRLLTLALKIKNDGPSSGGSGKASGSGANEKADTTNWRTKAPADRIIHAMIKGIDEYIEADVLELRPRYERSLEVVEGPLMQGMKEVGDRFGEGKMYLPQVIRSARVMKKAVAALEPFIQREKAEAARNAAPDNVDRDGGGNSKGCTNGDSGSSNIAGANTNAKILLATVKGDVHDIGKNIVGVVLGCNGYDIVDLGVMVPAEQILETAIKEKVGVIGLSGLITPSLDEMVKIAKALEQQGIPIPLLIGGATTSIAHTALRIAPEYSGPVVYVSDAGRSAEAVRALLSDTARPRFLETLERQYREAAALHETIQAHRELLPLEAARNNRITLSYTAPEPAVKTIQEFTDYPITRVIPHIDWSGFLHAWDMHSTAGSAAKESTEKLLEDAKAILAAIVDEKLLYLRGVIGFFPALSEGDDVLLFNPNSNTAANAEIARFSFLRNQEKKRAGGANPCLADFITPGGQRIANSQHKTGWLGLFALSAGFGLKEAEAEYKARHDDYGALLLASLANSLAEAFSAELHLRVQDEFWGYGKGADEKPGGTIAGIRPAFGYPACPDHEDKRTAFELLQAQKRCGLELTESAMIIPAASVCGMYIANPGAYYFGAGAAGEDQLKDWAQRKGISTEEGRRRIGRI
ncbi:methionine synthase [Spirochaetia bacterium]|nr:methionine synthase [Spirochaetia bacterium]